MKKVLLALLALFALNSYAFMDEVPQWSSVQIETMVDGEPVRVHARAKNQRPAQVVVVLRGVEITVPPEELQALPSVELNTIRIVSPDVKRRPGPTLRVEIQLEPLSRSGASPGLVQFYFAELAYQGRVVEQATPAGERVRELKQPGRVPERLK
jgi:hypothetical protein